MKNEYKQFIKALDMAYENRIPYPGVIFHSDRKIQYASDIFRQQLKNDSPKNSHCVKQCIPTLTVTIFLKRLLLMLFQMRQE